jgi:hypothetical protein
MRMGPKVPRRARDDNSPVGGAEGDRTPDLLIANDKDSDLRYFAQSGSALLYAIKTRFRSLFAP